MPTCTLPKARVAGLALSVPGVLALPLKGTLKLGFDALLVIATEPFAAPPVDGAKVTEKFALWPAARFRGRVRPLKLKPAPDAVACETVTVVLPELVKVAERLWVLPTWTLPKFRLEGFVPSDPAARPVPDSEAVTVELEALLVKLTVPLAAPAC